MKKQTNKQIKNYKTSKREEELTNALDTLITLITRVRNFLLNFTVHIMARGVHL